MSGERTVAIGTLSVFDCSHNRSCHGDFHICNKTIFLPAVSTDGSASSPAFGGSQVRFSGPAHSFTS